jgi:hypothetical protein
MSMTNRDPLDFTSSPARMTNRIRITELRDPNYDDVLAHDETLTWNEARQKQTYGHAPDCTLCALLDAVEAANEYADMTRSHILAKALNRFDFSQ